MSPLSVIPLAERLLKNLYMARKNPDFTFFYQVHYFILSSLVMKTFCPTGDENVSSQFLKALLTIEHLS